METKPDTRFQDQHAAAIYRAMALRFYERYVEMRYAAKVYGGDLVEHARLQEQAEAEDAYVAAVEACIWEGPDSAAAAMAMSKFVGILAADRLIGEILQLPVNDHRDAFHQSVALDALVQCCPGSRRERAFGAGRPGMSAEPENDPWGDMEEALNAVRGVACVLIGMTENQLKDPHEKDALGYLSRRLNEHCDHAMDAYRRARKWPEARP